MKKFIEFSISREGEQEELESVVKDLKYILEDEGFTLNFVNYKNLNIHSDGNISQYIEVANYNEVPLKISIIEPEKKKFYSEEFREFVDRIREDLPEYNILVAPRGFEFIDPYPGINITTHAIKYVFYKKKEYVIDIK